MALGFLICPCLFAGKEFLAAPGEKTVPDQLLVALQPGADIGQVVASIAPGAIVSVISPQRSTYLLRLRPGAQAATSRRLGAHPMVKYVEPDRIRHIAVLPPGDTLITQEWALTTINAVRGWSYFPDQFLTAATAGTGRVKVALLDTGVDCTHPDFMNAGGTSTDSAKGGQISWTASEALVPTTVPTPVCPWQDDNGHGTLSAGALAAATNNGAGVAALGFPLQLVVIKVVSSTGDAPDNIVAQGIDAAVSAGAQVISISLAGAGYSQTLQDAIDSAWQHNVLVVAAAGNNQGATLVYPGDGNYVLAVAASDTNNAAAGFSNYGSGIRIAAPGVSIESTLPTYANLFGGTNYGQQSGTSVATSFVSGLAGLLFAAHPNLSAAAVAQRIQQSAQTPNPGWNQFVGYGVIDAGAALAGESGTATQGGLTGQVVDSTNTPVSGAVVTAGTQSFTTVVDPTTEAATGLFRLVNLSPGSYTVNVTAQGLSPVSIEAVVVAGADTALKIQMGTPLSKVSGSVTYNGVGVGGAVVEALSGNPGVILDTSITDSSGAYSLFLPAGTYTFLASAPNYVDTSSASQNLGAGNLTVNLALTALGSFTGTVVDTNGLAIAGAHIHFSNATFSGGAFTDAGGRYTTFGLPSGTYAVTASASGFNSVTTTGAGISTNTSTVVNFRFSTGLSLSTGLAGYWPFNENAGTVAHDQSGNAFNANLSNTSWTLGLFSDALKFNGLNSQGVTSLIPFGNAFSIAAWVNPGVTSQTASSAIAEAQSPSGLFLGVDSTGTRYKFFVNGGTGSTGTCAFAGIASGCAQGGTVTPGWHLVTGTYDGTSGSLYLDGVLLAADTFTAPAAANLALVMGRNYSSGAAWDGVIDEVRLYGRALSAEEVAALYTQGTTQTLQLTKTADAALVTPGTAIGFRMAVTNGGAQAATGVVLSDPLPPGNGISWAISPAYAGPGTCTIANGTLTCNIASLAAAGNATVHVASSTSNSSCGIYPNTATASATNAILSQSSATSAVQCVCAVTGGQTTTVNDVQQMVNESLGLSKTLNDLNGDKSVNVADIQEVINAVLGLGCTY